MRLTKSKPNSRATLAAERGDAYIHVKVAGYSGRLATLQFDDESMDVLNELAERGSAS